MHTHQRRLVIRCESTPVVWVALQLFTAPCMHCCLQPKRQTAIAVIRLERERFTRRWWWSSVASVGLYGQLMSNARQRVGAPACSSDTKRRRRLDRRAKVGIARSPRHSNHRVLLSASPPGPPARVAEQCRKPTTQVDTMQTPATRNT